MTIQKRYALQGNTKITRSRWRLRRLRSKSTNCIWWIKIARSRDQSVIWLYGGKLLIVHNQPGFTGHRYCGSGDNFFLSCGLTWTGVQRVVWLNGLKFLIVTNHFVKLVAIDLVVVIQQLKYFTWPCKTKRSKDSVTLGKGTLHCISKPCQNW